MRCTLYVWAEEGELYVIRFTLYVWADREAVINKGLTVGYAFK